MNATSMNRRTFLETTGRALLGLGVAAPLSGWLCGCQGMGDLAALGSNIAAGAGIISQNQADSITRSARAVERSAEDITPEQEYYIGRTIGAMILETYRPYDNRRVNAYLNLMGQTLARMSDRPEIYNGYHFLALDSDDINALSAPGGFVFVTRGLLRCCRSEDAAAAVLAHEIGHVQMKHGLKAIQTSRITEAVAIIGVESAKSFSGADLASLTSVFEGAITDITKTLVNTGYGRGLEYEADAAAVTILKRVGYDPQGLADMLTVMRDRLVPGRADFASTHPSPDDRLAKITDGIGSYREPSETAERRRRFTNVLKAI